MMLWAGNYSVDNLLVESDSKAKMLYIGKIQKKKQANSK